MRSWIRLLAWLYPTGWRERYGPEFDALLEDSSLSWRDLLDVLRGALEMHMKTWGFTRTAAACGVAGAILAAGVAFWLPDKYVSTAVMAVRVADDKAAFGEHLNRVRQQAFSQQSLAEVIRKDNLYPTNGRRMRMEGVIQQMRRDIQLVGFPGQAGEPTRLAVRFVYGDPSQAQRTTRELMAKFMEANSMANRATTATARQSAGLNLEVLEAASLPRTRASPNRLMIIAVGVGVGLMLATLAVVTMRLPSPISSDMTWGTNQLAQRPPASLPTLSKKMARPRCAGGGP